MKAVVYHSARGIRVENVSTPSITEQEALVEMKACGICGSDMMEWYLKDRAPLVLGHEPAGIIAMTGEKVKDFEVGDRVFVHHHVACLRCHYCVHGDYTLCEQFHDTHIVPGGFAEYFKVPTANLRVDTLNISDDLPYEEATFIEPVGCCLRALHKCGIENGDSAVVIGAGAIGIINIALARMFGLAKVVASDLIDYRLKMAERFGADVAVNSDNHDLVNVVKRETGGRGADVVLVTAPSLEAYETAMKVVRKGGTLCVFAPTCPGEYLQISPKELFFSEIKFVPSYSTSHVETRMALELITTGRLKVKELITDRFKLEDAAQAFKVARENRHSLKVIISNE